MSDLQTILAESAWQRLVERRRRRGRLRKISIALLAVLMAGMAVLAFYRRDSISRISPLTVREIVLSNNRAVDGAEVLEILGIRAGEPWWRYDPGAVRERAAANPRIALLEVRYAWFNQLHVRVVEREPAMAVIGSLEGELTPDGWFLPSRRLGEVTDLPVLRPAPGTLPGHGQRVDRRTAAVARLVGALEAEHPTLWRDLSEVEMGRQEARAYLRSRRGVILFSPGLHDELWDRLPAVLGHLQHHQYRDIMLDLRFEGRIVVRLPGSSLSDTLVVATDYGKV